MSPLNQGLPQLHRLWWTCLQLPSMFTCKTSDSLFPVLLRTNFGEHDGLLALDWTLVDFVPAS